MHKKSETQSLYAQEIRNTVIICTRNQKQHIHYLHKKSETVDIIIFFRAATKLPHPCLSPASLWMVLPQWFMFFISASTVFHQVVFGRPRFHFPSGVQWIGTLVMELASLCSTCQIQCHHVLVMMDSLTSCWHRAYRSQL